MYQVCEDYLGQQRMKIQEFGWVLSLILIILFVVAWFGCLMNMNVCLLITNVF